MKTIRLHKSTIDLPDCWEDLDFNETVQTISILNRLFSGEIDPHEARIEMLMAYTGYKPNPRIQKKEVRDNINFNLIRLSEQLNFAFTVEESDNNTPTHIIPRFNFKRNPMPYFEIENNKYQGKIFNLDITAKTNIYAKEFIDAFDLYAATNKMENGSDKEECINQLCAILYPGHPEHAKNLVSGQIERMRKADNLKKRLVYFWFSGIVHFYTEHPIYNLLFSGSKEKDEDKIDIGMNAIALQLTKEGYGNMDTMLLNDYFDAQIQSLKDTIGKALSAGVKPSDIANSIGISLSNIHKLS